VSDTATGDLEERVAALAEKRRAEIEQLVRQRLDLIVQEVLDAEIAGRANGNGAVYTFGAADAPNTRLCRTCGERPAPKHRTECDRCRRGRSRPQLEEEPPGPFPGETSTSSPPGIPGTSSTM
jgi:hypothetical protein